MVSPYALDRPGGVQDQARGLSEHLERLGHAVRLIGPGRSDGSWISVGGVTEVSANSARAPVCLEAGATAKVREAIKGAHVVHVHEPLVPLVGLAAWITGDLPTVGTFHADPASTIRGIYRIGGPLIAQLLDRFYELTAVSEEAARAVQPFAETPRIIPNAVAVEEYRSGVDRDPLQVAFVGRDEPRKGLDVLLEAWPAVCRAVPGARLVVAGASRPPLPAVEFLGRVSQEEKRRLLASSGVFCAPNTGSESFGIVLLEGMAAQCAVVASDLPAFRSVGGNTAAFVPVGDAEALQRTLIGYLQAPALARVHGRRAGERAMAFDWSHVLPVWVDLYEQAVAANR